MTRKAGYPLDGAPGARGGAGSDVVEVRSALPPTAVQLPRSPLCVARHRRLAWYLGRFRGGGGGGVVRRNA